MKVPDDFLVTNFFNIVIMKKYFPLLITMILLIGCSSTEKDKKSDPRLPNIVLILADDMGYGDVGCYNPESKIPTPHIDMLASEGILFTDAHSPSALCTPTRYGLLTGRYCWRTRLKQGVILGYDEAPLIENGRSTIASMLKSKGYHTACIGKWHLGMKWQTKEGYVIQDDQNNWNNDPVIFRANEQNIDFTKPIEGGPVDLGFDYFFGTLGCSTSDPPYCFIENNMTVGIPSIPSPEEYSKLPGFVPGLMVHGWSLEEVDPIFTGKAIQFIEDHQNRSKDKPFFLYLALSSPHNPFLPPDFAKGKSLEGPRGDLVTVVDWSTGRILETLKKYELEDNTLVILTSDNGAMRGANGHKSSANFRGYKGDIWEGGHRIPFIVRWPDKIEPGSTSNEIISLTDMFATFAKLVSYKTSDNEGEDSYDILPAFLGKRQNSSDDRVRVFHSGSGVFALRIGQWKLVEGTKRSGSGKLSLTEYSLGMTGQLYNMLDDPGERNDLWYKEPEKVTELGKLLEKCKSMTKSNSIYNN